jgi:pimeloyl-ACP methyl ester carboxylesterase
MNIDAVAIVAMPMDTTRSRSLRALLVLLFVFAGYLVAAPPAVAQNVPVTTTNGLLPDGMDWRITMPNSGWNGTLLLDLDFVTGGVGSSYTTLYNRGYAAAGVRRIPFNQGGRDSRVSAAQLIQVIDVFTGIYGKPAYVITNGGSTGGVVAGYTLEHYPERIDGGVANCTVPGYIPYLMPRLSALFAAKVFFDIGLPILQHSGVNFNVDANSWRSHIDAAQATPAGKARIALALTLGQMNTWTSAALPAPDVTNLDQVQAYMYDTLRNLYAFDVNTRRNQEQQVGGEAFAWTTGFDYKKIFHEMTLPEQKAAVLRYYQLAGLDLEGDLQRINSAARIQAAPEAVKEIHLHGDYSGRPEKPFLMNNLIGDPLVQPVANQGYLQRAIDNKRGDLVRLIHVAGAGHCAFRANESVAAIEIMNERVRTGVWPSTAPSDLNLRASAINPALVPRFVHYQNPDFAGGFWTNDHYSPRGCSDLAAARAALGAKAGSVRYWSHLDVDQDGHISMSDIVALAGLVSSSEVCH